MHCGFNIDHYKEIVTKARDEGYLICPIKDYQLNEKHRKKIILLRHDVDFSLEFAYELANIEYDLGVCSTYHIYLHSPTYNALSPKSIKMIKEIKDMGHEIGLHAEGDTFDSSIQNEDRLLEFMIGDNIRTYSNHLWNLRKTLKIPYLIHPNNLTKYHYISDSGRNWREDCLCKNIGKHNRLHVLIHPEWWVTQADTRAQAVNRLWLSLEHALVKEVQEIKEMLIKYVKEDLKQKCPAL